MAAGVRVRTPTTALSLSLSPPPLSSRLAFRRTRFLIVSVRLFVPYLSRVLSLGIPSPSVSLPWNLSPRPFLFSSASAAYLALFFSWNSLPLLLPGRLGLSKL